jgi:hypothetical protein
MQPSGPSDTLRKWHGHWPPIVSGKTVALWVTPDPNTCGPTWPALVGLTMVGGPAMGHSRGRGGGGALVR